MQDFQLLKEKNIDLDNLIDKIRYCLSINGECQKCESRKNSKCSAFCDTELLIKAIHRLYKENEQLNQEVKEWTKANDSKMVKIVKLEDQIDELKEQKAFWEGMHDRVSLKLEEYDDKSEEYENTLVIKQCRITELQKQVDELTVKVKSLEYTDMFKEAYIAQLKEENQQAVKDTAEKYYRKMRTALGILCFGNDKIHKENGEIAKEFGVEVE